MVVHLIDLFYFLMYCGFSLAFSLALLFICLIILSV